MGRYRSRFARTRLLFLGVNERQGKARTEGNNGNPRAVLHTDGPALV
jgi:hypothetical protein